MEENKIDERLSIAEEHLQKLISMIDESGAHNIDWTVKSNEIGYSGGITFDVCADVYKNVKNTNRPLCYNPNKVGNHLVKITLQHEQNMCEFLVLIHGNLKGADVLKAAMDFDETDIYMFTKGSIQFNDNYTIIHWVNGDELAVDDEDLEQFIVDVKIISFVEEQE